MFFPVLERKRKKNIYINCLLCGGLIDLIKDSLNQTSQLLEYLFSLLTSVYLLGLCQWDEKYYDGLPVHGVRPEQCHGCWRL